MTERRSLDTLCAAYAHALGIEAPEKAAGANPEMIQWIDRVFDGKKADRLVLYNPDAIAQWMVEKYPHLCQVARREEDLVLPLSAVMPSVTPVCFGTIYTGAQPEIHGIQKYEKPVITIDTFFDALVRAGKKCALVTYGKCSLSKIFLERQIEYDHFELGGIEAVNAKAAELIVADRHDVIVIYNGNFDSVMHKKGPESPEALAELRLNASLFQTFSLMIEALWKHHNTLLGFAMDHGCHEIDGGCGSHGLNMDEDLELLHWYRALPKEKDR